MSKLETSQDGVFLFAALEDNATGNQLIFKITRPTSTTPTTVTAYEPGAGSSGNIAPTGDPNRMIFHGAFGGGDAVVDHAIVAGTNTEIGNGAETQPLAVDPSDVSHIVAYDTAVEEIAETENGGSSWSTLNNSLAPSPLDAMAFIFFGAYFPFGGFLGGNDSVDEYLGYSPNEFSGVREDTSAALKAVGSIVSIDIAPG